MLVNKIKTCTFFSFKESRQNIQKSDVVYMYRFAISASIYSGSTISTSHIRYSERKGLDQRTRLHWLEARTHPSVTMRKPVLLTLQSMTSNMSHTSAVNLLLRYLNPFLFMELLRLLKKLHRVWATRDVKRFRSVETGWGRGSGDPIPAMKRIIVELQSLTRSYITQA